MKAKVVNLEGMVIFENQTIQIMKPSSLGPEYRAWLLELKVRIRKSQVKAMFSANAALIELYWELGKEITDKQKESQWGEGVFRQLAEDLKDTFPEMKGFSRSNLYSIKQFYLFYQDVDPIVQQLVGQLPWGHNTLIIRKVKNPAHAIFYIKETVQNGWSRNILEIQIERKLHLRKTQSINNFRNTLPKDQADLAIQTLKDPYIFDFLSMESSLQEKELEKRLINHITHFLLELGQGFAFIGKQFNVKISETDYYIDLLFYHIRLRCLYYYRVENRKIQAGICRKTEFLPECGR